MMKSMAITPLSHQVLKLFCRQTDQRFQKQKNALEQVQREKLEKILQMSTLAQQAGVTDYESFKTRFPVTRYAQWRDQITACRSSKTTLSSSKLVRYQPTSGSSEQIKFIPYTQAFLDELDAAIAPWLSSMYRKCNQLDRGTHYWSVSWLPESQREVLKDENLNDDSALLGLGKRILSKFTQAVPSDVSFAAQADDALFATLCYLVADADLAMMSVWSPTFALQLLEKLNEQAEEIVQVLRSGTWQQRAASLRQVKAPHQPQRALLLARLMQQSPLDYQQLWPKLSLVSSWDTAGSKQWAASLHAALPFAQFEGKGLWATEGVVTIPYDDCYPLAYHSHFYEFEYLSGPRQGEIVASWELQLNDHVSPVLTSGNGLLRYCLDDSLRVTGFFGQVPCFEFQGRRFGVDLVGEKLSPDVAHSLIAQLKQQQIQAVSLFAVDTQQQTKPFYCVLVEGETSQQVCVQQIDQALRQHFHYELARDLGQLDQPRVCYVDNGWEGYKHVVMREGMIEGNIKPEPLKKVTLSSLEHMLCAEPV